MFDPKKVLPIVYDEVQKDFGRDCCVSGTATLKDILFDVYGIKSEPLAVETVVFNPFVRKKIEKNGGYPETAETLRRWTMDKKGWAVGIGQNGHGKASDGTGGLNGHAVLIVRDAEGVDVLMDVSIPQASRPHKNIRLAPIWFEAKDYFLKGERPAGFIKFGCLFSYKTITHNKDFLAAPDWQKWKRTGTLYRIKDRLDRMSPLMRK